MGQRFPETLSGGEQQRAAIARALVHRPALLLADEPTGNLDEDTAARIIELLTRLARQQASTMLLVTHSQAVARSADRVLRLSHGQINVEPSP
jgi:putative ABC transport system ATP-binding protein